MKFPELNQVLEMAWFPKRLQGTFPSADGNIGIIVPRRQLLAALSEL